MAKVHVFKVIKYGSREVYRHCPTFSKVGKWPTTLDTARDRTEEPKGKGSKAGPFDFDWVKGQIGWAAVWETEGKYPTWRWIEFDYHVSKKRKLRKLEIRKVLDFCDPGYTAAGEMK